MLSVDGICKLPAHLDCEVKDKYVIIQASSSAIFNIQEAHVRIDKLFSSLTRDKHLPPLHITIIYHEKRYHFPCYLDGRVVYDEVRELPASQARSLSFHAKEIFKSVVLPIFQIHRDVLYRLDKKITKYEEMLASTLTIESFNKLKEKIRRAYSKKSSLLVGETFNVNPFLDNMTLKIEELSSIKEEIKGECVKVEKEGRSKKI